MGKGKPRSVEKGVLAQNSSLSSSDSLNIPLAPVYYPTEDEFRDPLEYIYKIRPEAEAYGICKIVPPENWKPPFALELDSFRFPTKTQAIHQLQVRPTSCDSKTFQLEYDRFLEEHCGRKLKKKVVFEGEELDFCKLFNAVKRFRGYDKVVEEKKWREVSRLVCSGRKISECAKHVLCQLYREHLYDYEMYCNRMGKYAGKGCKRVSCDGGKNGGGVEISSSKRRRINLDGEKVKVCKPEKEEVLNQVCKQCRSGLHGEVMLLCDRCNKGWHIYCLSPPLKQIPTGNWYCLDCLNSDKDSFGFVPGKRLSLEAFKRVADRAKRKWFGSGSASRMQIEKKFWEIVEGSSSEVEVIYGSDLDTSLYGSGFPRRSDHRPESVEAKIWDEYCDSPWNLNNLPKLEGSMLRAVHHNITGVMVPWLYVGMLFSAFCWHFEDHCFYSMNYLHWGEPKCWYSVPGKEAGAFEKVMRKCLPDLFDSQPDLLFQLVTQLNPSVLQENRVPVYTVLQEPGNFVITFPRSYHAGFNFGFNCAEAVNFAPADWLPHGGFGSELYQLYHKPAVISHEELLCVVAKSGDRDSRVSPHLKKELLRIYTKEKNCREQLWRSGIVKSSPMFPRRCPEYVGTEEDPECVICQQYLYLSAVVCSCRPSAFVCLEHWRHLCECKSKKLCLRYRHTLAELHEMVLTVDNNSYESLTIPNIKRQSSYSQESFGLRKKVKEGHVTLGELAEQWLLQSCKAFENAFSTDAYATLLDEAEQFLWAGSGMDPVRDVARNMIQAKKWAEGIQDCLAKVKSWSCFHRDLEKVDLRYANELLSIHPVPCNEPAYPHLKDHVEDARKLAQEIDSAISGCPTGRDHTHSVQANPLKHQILYNLHATRAYCSVISELKILYSRACDSPFLLEQFDALSEKLSSAKAWAKSARKCISDKHARGVELDILHKLKAEILELQVQLPEAEGFWHLLRQAESLRARCCEFLQNSFNLKDVEVLLQELHGITVHIPELNLLKQYHSYTVLWIARVNNILINVTEREDQQNVVDELDYLLNEGASLRIQVDELAVVEAELKKASCRLDAQKALNTSMSLGFIKQLVADAVSLNMEEEKLFKDVSNLLETALHWENMASTVLSCEAQMSDFMDLIRMSEDLCVILPSLLDIKTAVSVTESWLQRSKLFLCSVSPGIVTTVPCSLLQLEALKELVSESKLLRVALDERRMIDKVFKSCEKWECDACLLLQRAQCILDMPKITNDMTNGVISEIESLVSSMESHRECGLSLGFDFQGLAELQNACSKLQWCSRALSCYSVMPTVEDVENLLKTAEHLSATCATGHLWSLLVDGIKWLGRALEIVSLSSNRRSFKLSDAEEHLAKSKGFCIFFDTMTDQLQKDVYKHKLWQDQANQFLSLKPDERTWSLMLHYSENGRTAAFKCFELDMIFSEVEKVEVWKTRCMEIVATWGQDMHTLLDCLQRVKQSLDRSLCIYEKSGRSEATVFCLCCSGGSEDQAFMICSVCKDCYHLGCLGQTKGEKGDYICHYCQFSRSRPVSRTGHGPLKPDGKRIEIKILDELLSDAANFCAGVEERDMLQQIMKKAARHNAYVAEIAEFAISYMDEDLRLVLQKLTVALKANDVAGVYDVKTDSKLELALARNSWRVVVSSLFEGLQKPTMHLIKLHLKEGVALDILPNDPLRQRLSDLKHAGLHWAERSKKVVADSGALGLDKVYELIAEGENLPVSLDKELKALRARSSLHCICRKPFDERSMVSCDQCGEWYHTDCMKLPSHQKMYSCPACPPPTEDLMSTSQLDHERSTGPKFVEPKTPSPQHTKSVKKPKKTESSLAQKIISMEDSKTSLRNGIDNLWWRNRKPFRRVAKKRSELHSLSSLFHTQTGNL